MADSLTTFSPRRKKNLLFTASAAVALGIDVAGAQSTTFDFTNDAGGDLWMNPGNWNQGPNLPNTGDVARIPSSLSNHGSHESFFITDGTLSGNATVGTFIVNTPKVTYAGIAASDAWYVPGHTKSDATITFGTANSAGGFVLNLDNPGEGRQFHVGSNPENDGILNWAVPNSLAVQVASDQVLHLNVRLRGSGPVMLSRLAGSGTIDAFVFIADDFRLAQLDAQSDFSGGLTVNPNVTLQVSGSSTFIGATLLRGPLGTGTTTLAGGTLILASNNQTMTIGNSLRLTADSTLTTRRCSRARSTSPTHQPATG
jgi:hypothetical protein